MATKNDVAVITRVTPETYRELQEHAKEIDRSVAWVLRDGIRRVLADRSQTATDVITADAD